jgi:pimeloyl-ACP methyl ester carboxylesterase
MQTVSVGDVEIGYRRAGAGPPLVLLHGAVSDSRVWRLALDSFADAFTVVAWDAPGCGGSSDLPPGAQMADYADCLAGFIGALGLGRADLVGHSWGSTLALELGLRHPALVRRLILVGGYAGWAGSLPADEVARRLDFAHHTADVIQSGAWDPTSMPGLFSDAMSPDIAAELVAIMSEIRAPATRSMAEALAAADLRGVLGDLSAPTLLVHGDADERSGLHVAHALQESIAGATLTVLPGLGHECYLEDATRFDTAVRDFLRTGDGTD